MSAFLLSARLMRIAVGVVLALLVFPVLFSFISIFYFLLSTRLLSLLPSALFLEFPPATIAVYSPWARLCCDHS